MNLKKKTSEHLLISTFSNFKINCGKTLLKKLSRQLPMELINQLMIEENEASYFQKYKTKELIDLIKGLIKKGINKKEHRIIINIILILTKRYQAYQSFIENDPDESPSKTIDNILYPSKLITGVPGTNIFTIVNWKQLNIEIHDRNPNLILFKKIINGMPNNDKVMEKKLDELHLGLTTRNILKTFGHLSLRESYKHPLKKKDQIFRLNKALKDYFKIPSHNNPFFWKKKQLFTDITITAYDTNNAPGLHCK